MEPNEKLRSAFIEAYNRDYDELDSSDEQDEFTEYDKKSKCPRLVASSVHRIRHTFDRRTMRIKVAAIVACLVMLFCGFMSVPAIREGIIEFVVEKFQEYSLVIFHGADTDNVERREEGKKPLFPDGYTIQETKELPYFFEAKIVAPNGEEIMFVRTADGAGISVDTEDAVTMDFNIDGYKCMGIEKGDESTLILSDEKYGYILTSTDGMEPIKIFVCQFLQQKSDCEE